MALFFFCSADSAPLRGVLAGFRILGGGSSVAGR